MLARSCAAFMVVVAVGEMGSARADRSSLHATAAGDVAFTDNVFQEKRENSDSDLFVVLRPGVLFSYGVPRMIHDLTAEAEITQYTLHSESASVAARAGWHALFFPSPLTELSVDVNAGTGQSTALTSTTPGLVAELRPLGNVTFRSADAGQSGSYTASRALRLAERLYARATESTDNASEVDPMIRDTDVTSMEAGVGLALERSWRQSAVSLEVGGSVVRLERVAPDNAIQPSRLDRQLNPRVRLSYGRDIDRRVTANIDGGLVYVIPYGVDPYNPDDGPRDRGLFPVVGGALSYSDEYGVGTMSVRRDVSPNLFLGRNTVADSAQISAAMPIPYRGLDQRQRPKLVGVGSISMVRTQLVDPVTADLAGSYGAAAIQLGAQYNVRPGFAYTVRYELVMQTGDSRAEMPVNGFFRNTVMFSFAYRYPEDIAAPMPNRKARQVGSEGDEQPGGGEPVITDMLDQGGAGGRR